MRKHRRGLWHTNGVLADDFASAILEKAEWLVRNGRIRRVSEDKWVVRGLRSKHIVKRGATGYLYCDCKGFHISGTCSHVISILLAESKGVKAEA